MATTFTIGSQFLKLLKINDKRSLIKTEKKISDETLAPLSLPEVDVAIFAEGTYPYLKGGVSSVVHQIIEEHPHKSFGIVHIAWSKDSKLNRAYPKLPQVKWVHVIYLSQLGNQKNNNTPWRQLLQEDARDSLEFAMKKELFAKKLIKAISDILRGEYKHVPALYRDFFNPLTRKVDIKKLVNSSTFFNLVANELKEKNLPLVDLYWLQKELSSITLALLDQVYPKAKVYHSHTNGHAGVAAAMASFQHGRKFVLTEHSLYIRDVLGHLEQLYVPKPSQVLKASSALKRQVNKVKKETWAKWFQIMGRIVYKKSATTTYLYSQIAKDAQSYGSIARRAKIIPNGIDFSKFEKTRLAQAQRQIKRVDKSSDFKWRIGLIARVVPVKGVLDFIDAIKHLQELLPNRFEVEVIGPTDEDPHYYNQCLDKVKELKLEGLIRFLGAQNVATFLEDIDIVAMSSLSEALPVVILESMASTVPVVSTDVGSVRQILEQDYKNDKGELCAQAAGLVCPPRNPKALAKGLADMMKNPQIYDKCKENAPLRISHAFMIKDIMDKYGDLYQV